VDRLRGILHGGKGIIASMEAQEKERTGIRTLKIGYNKVFGYYIEVSNSFRDMVPETYIRKQTLVNGERFITQELKDLEHDILSAADRVGALEYDLFTRLRLQIAAAVSRVQQTAAAVAELERIADQVEDPQTSFDDIRGLVERSQKLVDGCRKYLLTVRETLEEDAKDL
jgi:DNA mismatch repair protein MutS